MNFAEHVAELRAQGCHITATLLELGHDLTPEELIIEAQLLPEVADAVFASVRDVRLETLGNIAGVLQDAAESISSLKDCGEILDSELLTAAEQMLLKAAKALEDAV